MPALFFVSRAEAEYLDLKENPARKVAFKAVRKALDKMAANLRHPSLNTHEYHSLKGPNGEKVFEAYAQNRTPGAYRIFWCYGPGRDEVTVLAITPHP